MKTIDLVTRIKNQAPIEAIDLPCLESLADGQAELEKAEGAYLLYKRLLQELHKIDKISDPHMENSLIIEEDHCATYEDCTVNILHELLGHVSGQIRKYRLYSEEIEGWIDNQVDYEKEWPTDGDGFKT